MRGSLSSSRCVKSRRLLCGAAMLAILTCTALVRPEERSAAGRPRRPGAAAKNDRAQADAEVQAAAESAGSRPELEHRTRTPDPQVGVVLLVDGRVVRGKVSEAADGYFVEGPQRKEMLPHSVVQLTADSLEEAYEKLRDARRKPTPSDHLDLAAWCRTQGLIEAARSELAAGLRLDPARRDLRGLLTQIEEETSSAPRHLLPAAVPATSPDGFAQRPLRSPLGLTREATAQFVQRVQPLLVNKCANVACHGAETATEFQILSVNRDSTSRLANERNLAEVLACIDADAPADSPLLRQLDVADHARLFEGAVGERQRKAIEDWVQRVAAESQPGEAPLEAMSTALAGDAALPAADPLEDGVWITPREQPARRRPLSSPKLRPIGDAELLQQMLDDERPDPFDPEVFNREVHDAAVGTAEHGSRR